MPKTPDECARKIVALMGDNQELKGDLRDARIAYEFLEQERTFHAAKAVELQEVLDSRGNNDLAEKLVEKSVAIAEMSMEIDRLKMQLQEAGKEKVLMDQEREASVEMMAELSKFIRRQKLELDGRNSDIDEEENDPRVLKKKIQTVENERDDFIKKCKGLEQMVDALKVKNSEREIKSLLSLRQMRGQIDSLEEEHRLKDFSIAPLKDKIKALDAEGRSKDEKIAALEQHFQIFNSVQNQNFTPEEVNTEVKQDKRKFTQEKHVVKTSEIISEKETRDDRAYEHNDVKVINLRDKFIQLGSRNGVLAKIDSMGNCDQSTDTESTAAASQTYSDPCSTEEFVIERLEI